MTQEGFEDVPPYLAAFGMICDPFTDMPSGHFYYASDDGKQRLDLMLHLAPYSPLLLIIGKRGAGKTVLLRQFASRASPNWRVAAVAARVDMGRDELLKDMIRGFGLLLDHRADYQELYTALVAQLKALRQNAQIPILLLDDAQFLSAAMLEMLLKLCEENDNGHILSLVLFGTPQLQNLLDGPANKALAARITHAFAVSSLTEDETRAYIRHRLRAAGAIDDGPFDVAAMARIYAISGGSPAQINEQALRILRDKGIGGDTRRPNGKDAVRSATSGRRKWVFAAALLIAILIVLGPLRSMLFQDEPLPQVAGKRAVVEKMPIPATNSEGDRIIRSDDSPSTANTIVSPAPKEAAKEEQQILALPSSIDETAIPIEPVPAPAKTVAATGEAIAAGPIPQPEPQGAPPPAPAVSPAKTPDVPSANLNLQGMEWVRAQAGDNYTLQLMALAQEKAAIQFIESHRLQDKAAYFPAKRNGQTLYTIVYGVFPTRADAIQAARKLPVKWGVSNPWARSFKGLRGEPSPVD